jgi:tetratricopeptide (TPR) repeat protein
MLRNNVPDLPLWLNEGLAEYFETFDVERGRAEFGGERFWARYLTSHDWIDYRDVLRARVDSPLYRDPALSDGFRAQAWALTHLLYDPDNREALIRFMAALAQGGAADHAVVDSLDTTFSGLEKIVRNHVRSSVMTGWVIDLDSLGGTVQPEIRDLQRVEVLTNLGSLLATLPTDERSEPARRLLEAALREAPEHHPALVGKATLQLRRGEDVGEARQLLERAVALAPGDATARYFRGQASLRLFEEGAGDGAVDLLAAARHDFEQVQALDPHFRSAANALAHTYLYEPPAARKGIEIAERELARGPHIVLAVTLMELHATLGDQLAARKVYDEKIARWLDSSAESGAAAVSKAVERTDLTVARAWEREGRCEEAADLLRTATEHSSHEDVAEELRATLEALGECTAGAT